MTDLDVRTGTKLVSVANQLNKLRIKADAIEAIAPQDHAYGDIANALRKVMGLLCGGDVFIEPAYQALVDGEAIGEAIAIARDRVVTYPVGTNVWDIARFDRSTKVVFGCKEHPGPEMCSKSPGYSNWFPATEYAREIEFGTKPDPCTHTNRDDVWVTTREYTA